MKKQFMTLLNACLVLASLLLLWRLSIWIFRHSEVYAADTLGRGQGDDISWWIASDFGMDHR